MHIPVCYFYLGNIAFLWFGVLGAITESDLILSQIKFPETEEILMVLFQIITLNQSSEKQDNASGKGRRHTCLTENAAENKDVDRPLACVSFNHRRKHSNLLCSNCSAESPRIDR